MTPKTELLSHLDKYPNTPYLSQSIQKQIHEQVEPLKQQEPELQIFEDELAIYIHYHKKPWQRKIVIDTHLDHPGFAINHRKEAVAIGTIIDASFTAPKNELTLPVIFYDSKGNYIDHGELSDFQEKNGRWVGQPHTLHPANTLLPNSQAIASLKAYNDRDMMFMRSADNLATSAIMLELIEWLISTSPGGNITFIFNKLEEVRQVSATGIAKRKHTMSEPIDQNTFIIILEAASVEPTPLSEAVHKKMTYTDGPVIRVSDGDIVYQQSDKTNQAEHLALNAAANARLEIQHGPLTNNCNSTPHILFGNTPHVIGVTIPCEHKHNFTNEGTFEHEAIRISDLHTTTKLLQQMITDIDAPIKRNTSALLEQIYPVYRLDPQSLTSKRKLWSQSYAWALPRLQSGQLFPTNQLSATRLRLKHIKASIQSR